jgi:DNA-binding transcriptional regulator YhcF (GntR family)
MEEALIFQRRNRLKKHFVTTSNVLLYGYVNLSDAAKITYQVIDGFDWESKETGDSKGYAFPAVETLASIRHTTMRTIQRHIQELEAAKLLTRQRRRYKPSILFIEEIADAEAQTYLARFVEKPTQPGGEGAPKHPTRNDKNVVSPARAETTKMTVVYQKEKEPQKENESNVGNANDVVTDRKNGIVAVRTLLQRYDLQRPPSNPTVVAAGKRDYLATVMAEQLGDGKSLACYRLIAAKIPSMVIFGALGNVKETAQAGKIRKSRAALFMKLIQQYAQQQGIALGLRVADEG